MKLSELQPFDIVNSHYIETKWYDVPGRSIQKYQRHKFRLLPNARWRDTHSILITDRSTRFFEVTSPVTRYGYLSGEWDDDKFYSVSRYVWTIPPAEQSALIEVCDHLDGTRYDYFQLLDIAIKEVIGWPYSKPLSILDLGRKRKVCSVAVISAYLNWWTKYGKMHGIERPLGNQDAEVCCPADFVNRPGYFEFLGQLHW